MTPTPIPTPEQEAALIKPVAKGVIKALAGAGKTTFFRMFANRFPHFRILYIAYNRAIVDAAALPGNAKSLTGHQLAFQFVGKYYQRKFASNLSMGLIKHRLNCDWSMASGIVQTLENYFCSEDADLLKKHAPVNPRNAKSVELQPRILESAKKVWLEMQDLNGQFPMTHDGYLKGFTASNVDLSEHFDVLLIDEAQDLNPCMQAFVKAQSNMKIYLCGDQSQQIYAYRGATNSLGWFESLGAEVFTLTQSFRFNSEVAEYANKFLSQLKVKERVKGTDNGIERAVVDSEDDLDPNEQIAYINRTVAKTIETAIEADRNGKKIYWTGGFKNYPFTDLFDVLYLKHGEHDKIKSREVKNHYSSFGEYVDVAKETNDLSMVRIVKLIKEYEEDLHSIYESLKASAQKKQSNADVVVGTCHRTKGLEFKQVVLGDDFTEVEGLLESKESEITDELNLMYVAVTRAQLRVVPSYSFESISRLSGCIYEKAKAHQANKRKQSKSRNTKRYRGSVR